MKHKPTIFLFILSGISLLFIILEFTTKVSVFRNLFYYILSPSPEIAIKIVDKTEILGENIISFVKTHQENQKLKQKLYELGNIYEKYETLLKENTELRELLNLQKRTPYKIYVARVIGRDPINWFKTILIDIEKLPFLKKDLPVINIHKNQICLIGRIIEIEGSTANVLMLTDPISHVPVKVIRSGETGIIIGQNTSELLLDYLLPESDIRIGDKIITSGIGEIFPEGIPVGIVHKVIHKNRTYFKQAIVKPFINWNKINLVLVLQK